MNIKETGAAEIELRFLLNRGYHKSSALKFVADKHQLDLYERNFLTRKVFSDHKAKERKKKLVKAKELKHNPLLIDGYNVLITLESVLFREYELIKSDDDVFRDSKAVFGKYKPNKLSKDTLSVLIDFLKPYKSPEVRFLYDSPVSLSGELSKITESIINQKGLNGVSETSKNVDKELIKLSKDLNAIVATSDGIIIDQVDMVIDLPGAIYFKRKK